MTRHPGYLVSRKRTSRYNARMATKLSPQRITSFCRDTARHITVQVVEETGSTNADLLSSVDTLTAPQLLVAEKQTAGRGRAGRTWHSAPGASLTFSLAWKFGMPVQALIGLPLAVGVALAETLGALGIEVQLKWPNDVLHEGGKLAGILIETTSAGNAAQAGSWAVVGIGVNMTVSEQLAARIDRPVATMPRLAELDQDRLMANLLSGLAEALAQFEHEGLAAFVPRWNALHAYTGQSVVILDNGRVLHEGIAAGIDASGRFLLDGAAGRIAVMAGDVSLRVKEG